MYYKYSYTLIEVTNKILEENMKKLFAFLGIAVLGLTLVACEGEENEDNNNQATELPETVSADELDNYLYDEDWQFVDLRNFDDQMSDGWIRGFEIIPFFMYLEREDILVRSDGWDFQESDIKNESALRELFDEDKNIVMLCAAGTRAGYVKSALESLGYENVWNAGSVSDYDGDGFVYGDGSFTIELPHKAEMGDLPEEIDMSDDLIDYYLGRDDVQFVDLRNFEDKLNDGWHSDSTVVPFFNYLESEEILVRDGDWEFSATDIKDEDTLRNIFDEDKNIILICAAGTRAGYVKSALEELGYENVWNAGALGDYEGTNLTNPNCDGSSEDSSESDDGGCE